MVKVVVVKAVVEKVVVVKAVVEKVVVVGVEDYPLAMGTAGWQKQCN